MTKCKNLLRVILVISHIVNGSFLVRFNNIKQERLSSVFDVEEILLLDIIKARSADNIVLINSLDFGSIVLTAVNSTNVVAITHLEPHLTTSAILEDVANVNLMTNRKSFYIIIPDGILDVVKLIKDIRLIDYEGKIAVIYHAGLDVVGLYGGLGVYNVYLFVFRQQDKAYKIFDICMFCKDGKDLVEHINTWREGSGFSKPVKLQPSFRGNYHGTPLKIGSFYLQPNIYVTSKHENGTEILDGAVYRFYMSIARNLNATLRILTHRGRDLFNFNLYAKDLKSGLTDMVGGGLLCNFATRNFFAGDTSTHTATKDGYKIISIEPKIGFDPLKAFIAPFDKYIWGLLLSTIPLSGLVLYILRRLYSDRHQKANLCEAFWYIIVLACWDSIRSRNPSLPVIIHLSCFMMVYQLLINLYLGDYAATLIVPKYVRPPVDSLKQLWEETEMKWVSGAAIYSTDWRVYFNDPKNAGERLVNVTPRANENHYIASLRMVSENPDTLVHFNHEHVATYYINEYGLTPKGRKFYFSKDSFRGSFNCLYYNKYFYAKEALNYQIMLSHSQHIMFQINNFYSMINVIKSGLRTAEHLEENLDLIKFEHFKVGLYCLGAAYSISVAVLVMEITV